MLVGNQEKGHALVVEDLKFIISGVESPADAYSRSTGGTGGGTGGINPVNEDFYYGDPTASDKVPIVISYDQGYIEVTPTEETQDVCYYGYARAEFTITNTRSEFIFINSEEFITTNPDLFSQINKSLTFLLNDIDLAPYWDGTEDMYANMEYVDWQNFTINPGQTLSLSIIAEGMHLESFDSATTIVLPMTDINTSTSDQDVKLTMNYTYGEDCELDEVTDPDTDGDPDTDVNSNGSTNVNNGGNSLTNTSSTSVLPVVAVSVAAILAVFKNKFVK